MDFLSVVSGAIGATLLTCIFNLWSKNTDYKNDYYRKVIDKRLKAYESLEKIAGVFESTRCDFATDKITLAEVETECHSCFTNRFFVARTIKKIGEINDQSLWISSKIHNKINEINDLLLSCSEEAIDFNLQESNDSELEIIRFGVDNFSKINKMHIELRRLIANAMMILYDVKGFLKERGNDLKNSVLKK